MHSKNAGKYIANIPENVDIPDGTRARYIIEQGDSYEYENNKCRQVIIL